MSDRLFHPSVFGNRSQIWRICLGLFLIVIIYVSSSFGWFIALDRLAQIRLEGLGSTPADLAALLFSFSSFGWASRWCAAGCIATLCMRFMGPPIRSIGSIFLLVLAWPLPRPSSAKPVSLLFPGISLTPRAQQTPILPQRFGSDGLSPYLL